MYGAALDRDSIRQLIESPESGELPLLQGFLDLEEQLQPNSVDLTLRSVSRLVSSGAVGRDNRDRRISETEPMALEPAGWVHLAPESYVVSFHEVVNIPLDIMALGLPRSSLLRSGVGLHTAVWDAGYRGRSQALISVSNPAGFRIQEGARLMQLVFFRLVRQVGQGYQGQYQDEGT